MRDTNNIRETDLIALTLDGERMNGTVIGFSRFTIPLVRWTDGSVGRLTQDFIDECERFTAFRATTLERDDNIMAIDLGD